MPNTVTGETEVKILFFAKSRELAGCKEIRASFPTLTSPGQLKEIIVDNFNLGSIRDIIILAINQEYLPSETEITLQKTDEIAIIPPLSGG